MRDDPSGSYLVTRAQPAISRPGTYPLSGTRRSFGPSAAGTG